MLAFFGCAAVGGGLAALAAWGMPDPNPRTANARSVVMFALGIVSGLVGAVLGKV